MADVTCPLCNQLYRDPLMLPCLCKECLVTSAEKQDSIVCPTCNEVSSIPVFAIPQNLGLRQCAEREMKKQKVLASPAICERCTRDSPAICLCGSCYQLLCSVCEDDHKFSHATSSHSLTDASKRGWPRSRWFDSAATTSTVLSSKPYSIKILLCRL